jgi:tetratricopeptide (TPR) repeat protein
LIYYYRGQFARSAETFARVNAAAKRTGDFQYQAWGLYWQSQGYLQLGQLDRALALLQETLPLLERTSNTADRIQAIITYGLFAQTHLQRGEFDQARQAAAKAVQYIVSASITSGSALEGYVGPVETYLALWEAGDQSASGLLQKPLKILHRYGHIFPIARPRLLRCQGLADWLARQPEKARKAWQDSQQSAEEKAMPLEKALAHYEIGRHLPKGDPGRADHLGRARELFTSLGCAHHLERVERALDWVATSVTCRCLSASARAGADAAIAVLATAVNFRGVCRCFFHPCTLEPQLCRSDRHKVRMTAISNPAT